MSVYTWYKNILHLIVVLIVFLAANEKNYCDGKKYQDETASRQRQDSVPVSDVIATKIDTQKKNTGTGHQQDRYEIETTVKTACKTRT